MSWDRAQRFLGTGVCKSDGQHFRGGGKGQMVALLYVYFYCKDEGLCEGKKNISDLSNCLGTANRPHCVLAVLEYGRMDPLQIRTSKQWARWQLLVPSHPGRREVSDSLPLRTITRFS